MASWFGSPKNTRLISSSCGRSTGGGSTRCVFEHQRSLVHRRIRSPVLMIRLPGTTGASIHSPLSSSTCRPPIPGSRSSTVSMPKSVWGPIRNWSGSGSPAPRGPYQLSDTCAVVASLRSRNVDCGRPSASDSTSSSSSLRVARRPPPGLGGIAEAGGRARPHVRCEPARVAVAQRRVGHVDRPVRVRLLQVGRGLHAVRRRVRLEPGPDPAAVRVAHHRHLGLHVRGLVEERSRLLAALVDHRSRHAVVDHHEEPEPSQVRVDVGGEREPLFGRAVEPRVEVDQRDRGRAVHAAAGPDPCGLARRRGR